jgi:FMN phosphatase YigB (HAD superfamily)
MATTLRQQMADPRPGTEQKNLVVDTPRALFSCDVFDTAVTRLVGSPNAVFLLLGRRLNSRGLLDLSPQAFMAARLAADYRANYALGRGWHLRGIYRELQFALGLSDELRDRVMAEELALEFELIRPVPAIRERLSAARAEGRKVVFLSDMYIDSQFIRSVLDKHGLCTDGDGCYVSSETACGKEDGRAFRRLAQVEGVPLQDILHRGNDPVSDVAAALRAGVQVEPAYGCNPNRFEEILEHASAGTDGLASVMAGASRLARLSVHARNAHEESLRDVAAGVGAPMMVSYVMWLLREAQRAGHRRLYFVARDGYILRQIADRLIRRLGYDIETRYLYGGRRAWFKASVLDTERPDLFWAIDHSAPNSVASFMKRLVMKPDDVEDALTSLGHPRSTWKDIIPEADYGSRLWALLRHPDIRRHLLQDAAARRSRVVAYLRQEGLFDSDDFAVVDIGWSGRAVGALDRILSTEGARIPAVYFFGRLHDTSLHAVRPQMPIHVYYSDHTRRLGYSKMVYELYAELFLGAEHGVTVDYAAADGRMVPVLGRSDNRALTEWGLGTIHETMLSFVDHLWLDEDTISIAADMRPALARLFFYFINHPTDAEARAWGAVPFEDGASGVVRSTLAAPYKLRELPRSFWRGWAGHEYMLWGTEWHQASIRMTPEPVRFLFRASMRIRRMLGPFAKRLVALVRGKRV